MTVYEGDDRPDKYGNHPIRFKGYKNLEEVNQWLFDHYNGYHFVVIFNEMGDEYAPLGKELLVYYTDTVLDELAYIYDKQVVKKE